MASSSSSSFVPVAITAVVAGGIGAAVGYALAKPKTVAAGDARGYVTQRGPFALDTIYTGPLPGVGVLPSSTSPGYTTGGENPIATAMKRMGVTCADWYRIPNHDRYALMANIGVKGSDATALATSINLLCMVPQHQPA